MYCKLCDIVQTEDTYRIGKIDMYLCKGCFESLIDKYYESMFNALTEKDN